MSKRFSSVDILIDKYYKKYISTVNGPGLQPYAYVIQDAETLIDVIFQYAPQFDLRLRALMQIAIREYCWTFRRAKVRYAGWGKHGMVWEFPYGNHGEHHARCIFCRENLATMGAGVHRLGREFIQKIESHTFVCALRTISGYAGGTFLKGPGHAYSRAERSFQVSEER